MIKFGTGGWRAIIGDEFIRSNIELLAKAVATKMKDEGVASKGIVIGYDRRFLSKEAMQWSARVFAQEGIEAYLINKSVPTPVVMFYVMKHELAYGMMVTASHNPALYNGIKVFTAGGRDADEIQTAQIEEYIKKVSAEGPVEYMEYDEGKEKGLIHEIYPLNEYIDSIISRINMDAIKDKGLRVVLDPMYGVSETSLRITLQTARCEVETIHDRHDTLFGGKLPAPTAATLHQLQNVVLDGHYDIGIATDGDADRIGVIDDKGKFLHPNEIMALLYYYLEEFKGWKGPVVRNVCTTHVLDRMAEKYGEKCYEVPVGFKHISAKMNETDAVIGGESSGGLTVRGHIKGKDGVYAAMLLVEMIAVTGKKLSQIIEDLEKEFGNISMEENDYHFTRETKAEIMNRLLIKKELPEFPYEVEKVSYLDGSKVYFKNGGWIIARFSGTEPLLRIYAEMPDTEDAKKLCKLYEEFLGLKHEQ
ncbi:MAG: phosphoglucomutase/phosphomannomutase family protein [Butyrivibrio sp.]|nr:phosphoglucomutase/phosphomannomutase family protein [Butyrivibrio sp.]